MEERGAIILLCLGYYMRQTHFFLYEIHKEDLGRKETHKEDLFSLCVIHKEGLCPSSGDINRLMMTRKICAPTVGYWYVCMYILFARNTQTLCKSLLCIIKLI
jgi:hypothetical protein